MKPGASQVPLVVDLDGTLIRSDLLFEGLMLFIRAHFLQLWRLPLWLLRGKAGFKQMLAAAIELDPANLPYDQILLAEIAAQRAQGRLIVMATGATRAAAELIARHLKLFDRVHASEGALNLSARAKAGQLVAAYGERGFDYIGNARGDLPIWRCCRAAYSVTDKAFLLGDGRRTEQVGSARAGWAASLLAAMRPRQWLKNLLVFVPMLAAHALTFEAALGSLLAFAAFSLCASSAYLFNDALDVQDDRLHPSKCKRPIAAGALPLALALKASALLAALALVLCALAAPRLLPVTGVYFLSTLGYTLYLKRLPMVDIVTLAILYTLRILGGSASTGIAASFWLLAFSFFIFLSLALLKRHSELTIGQRDGRAGSRARGYTAADTAPLGIMGINSALLSILVFMLFFNSQNVVALYPHPTFLLGIVPLLVLWLGRLWLLSFRAKVDEDPILYVSRDPLSLAVIGACAALAIAASL
jgi:4-hydroxybenzoate polyprenyltransferase